MPMRSMVLMTDLQSLVVSSISSIGASMKRPAAILLLAASVGCGGASMTGPSKAGTSISSDPTLTFSGLAVNGAPVTSYSEAGFTVTAATPNWTAVTTYGKPAPFIEFSSDAGAMTTGEIRVAADGAAFYFQS